MFTLLTITASSSLYPYPQPEQKKINNHSDHHKHHSKNNNKINNSQLGNKKYFSGEIFYKSSKENELKALRS